VVLAADSSDTDWAVSTATVARVLPPAQEVTKSNRPTKLQELLLSRALDGANDQNRRVNPDFSRNSVRHRRRPRHEQRTRQQQNDIDGTESDTCSSAWSRANTAWFLPRAYMKVAKNNANTVMWPITRTQIPPSPGTLRALSDASCAPHLAQ
jgi:hypothetical protein